MDEKKRDRSELKNGTVLFAPSFRLEKQDGLIILFKPEEPNWLATNSRGAKVLGWIDGNRTLKEIIVKYAQEYGGGISRAWLHCVTLIREAMQCGFVSTAPFSGNGTGYGGRGDILKLENLEELWLHLTNACNLECTHCLVNSSPRKEIGIPLRAWEGIIKDAIELGVRRFYVTGGEPFIRKDLGAVVRHLAEADPDKIVFLTNGTLLKGRNLQVLSRLSSKVELQISLEGPNKKINDPIRGVGSFETAVRGIKRAVEMGITPVIATTLMKETLLDLHETTRLASSLGAAYHHIFLLHRRGRALGKKTPTTRELLDALARAIDTADETGIKIDNYETAKHRVAEGRGVKRDLSSAAWSSLCIYWDGRVFPSASLAGIKTLDMGSAVNNSLAEIWSSSKVGKELRGMSVVEKGSCSGCSLKFICGGGDVEYSYLHQGDFLAPDPFCAVHKELLERAILDIAGERCSLFKKAQDAPRVFFSMAERIGMYEKVHSLKGTAVATTPSNCVLFLDLEASREVVRDFYARAAKEPREELCCSSGYSGKDTSHIPREVLKVAYGCGSPVEWAGIKPGEVVVDLGSGGGIDCFVAAKAVGSRGKVIGIDMTREMLEKAEENKKKVAEKLGYDVVEFKKGYLEEVPLRDSCADVVLSNCVINLSPDKERVFSEIWRVLKNHGRAVISDTISSEKVPLNMRMNPRLWGECVSGALTEEEFLNSMERVGFYGISVLKKSFWRAVEGKNFYSAVIRGYKLTERRGCRYIGQRVVYTGPFRAVMDEEGHLFPRGEEVGVCTDTAAKLRRAPYASAFRVIDPEKGEEEYRCCDPNKGGPC